MPCYISCTISTIFLIGMIYMTNATTKSHIMEKYRNSLPKSLLELYDSIVVERTKIYYTGYALGFLLAIIIILYNTLYKENKASVVSLICTIVACSFLVNYFYYILSPKKQWMLPNLKTPEQNKAWLEMYRGMQVYYHSGLFLGLIAVGFFGLAFRC